jgi:hypothetical protein
MCESDRLQCKPHNAVREAATLSGQRSTGGSFPEGGTASLAFLSLPCTITIS